MAYASSNTDLKKKKRKRKKEISKIYEGKTNDRCMSLNLAQEFVLICTVILGLKRKEFHQKR